MNYKRFVTSFAGIILAVISLTSSLFAAEVTLPSYASFGGSTITPGAANGGSTFTVPSVGSAPGIESWAGFGGTESTEVTYYPFSFSAPGQITVNAAVPSGGSATLRFVFEYMAHPNNTPSFAVEIPVSGSSLQTYTATLPAQGDNTFSNLVFYVNEKDVGVEIVDIQVAYDDPDPDAPIPGAASETTLPNTNWTPFDGSGTLMEVVDGIATLTYPTGAQSWAGFANQDNSIYPFSFNEAGQISFTASVPSGGSADVRFRFEKLPYPNVDPSYDTESITITGSTPTVYTVNIPSQAANTFQSFLFYVETLDVPVQLGDVTVFDDAGAPEPIETGLYFKFEDVVDSNGAPEHYIQLNEVEVTNTTPQSYSITVPAYSDPDQVFRSMLFYVVGVDQSLVLSDVTLNVGNNTYGGTGTNSLVFRTQYGGAQEVDDIAKVYGVPTGSETWAGYKLGNPELAAIQDNSDGGLTFSEDATLTFTAYLSDDPIAANPDYVGETAFSAGNIDTSGDSGSGIIADGADPYKWSASVTYFDVNSDDTEGAFGGHVATWSPLSNLPATWDSNDVITLAPNTSAYNTWNEGSDGSKFLHQYLMIEGAKGDDLGTSALLGQTVTFTGTVDAFTLDSRYEVSAFVGYVEGDTATREEVVLDSSSGSFSITYDIPSGNYIPQLGFVLRGRNINPADVDTYGNIQFSNLVGTYSPTTSIPEGNFTNGSASYWGTGNGVSFNSDGGYGAVGGQVVLSNSGSTRSSVFTVSNQGNYSEIADFGLEAGKTYDVSYYMNRISGSDLGLLQFLFYVPGAANNGLVYSPADSSSEIHDDSSVVNGEWSQYSQQISVPEGATHAILYVLSGAGSNVAFDQIAPSAANVYANWILDLGIGGSDASFNADPDNDGIPNGLEKVFGTSPDSHSGAVVSNVVKSANSISMQHTKASSELDDISVSYQWSSDLINWNESGVSDSDGTTITIVPTDNSPTVGTTTATAIISAGSPEEIFIKVSASNE